MSSAPTYYAGWRHGTPGYIWISNFRSKWFRDLHLDRNLGSFALSASDSVVRRAVSRGLVPWGAPYLMWVGRPRWNAFGC